MSKLEIISAGQRVDADRMERLDEANEYRPHIITPGPVVADLGGGATVRGSYHRQGLYIVGNATIRLGSSPSIGTGRVNITLPEPVDLDILDTSGTGGQGSCVGTGYIRDSSAATNSRVVNLNLSTQNGIQIVWMQPTATNSSVSNTVPFTWAVNDAISISFRYQAAA